ncbi:DUF2752 domain-containing protein [Mucilaginibacter sp.]|uniref:DUF2752 domain-containing protein n=1 Tax=Mucilaginibacter sp. TaxID=1882438 RepID=UPI0026294147|nr:DUF2752 domain-containing protein [Mucilaginibacter sp.]
MIKFLKRNFELIFWVTAIIALAVADPSVEPQYPLCPLKLMGITWCPGCGIGHAISWLIHGNLANSWRAHWLGVPALILITYRIYVLGRGAFGKSKQAFSFNQQ